jgi:SAM-dependent methyltransferase
MALPTLYGELAPWYPLFSPPAHYVDEAAALRAVLDECARGPFETLLELGAGAGHLASHWARDLRLTLTDVSPPMLELSRALNPGAEHAVGDMRALRLGRAFDAVLAHDALCYLTSESDVRAAVVTAFEHLRPGGVALFVPDYVRETFEPGTEQGGSDGPPGPDGRPGRGVRYLSWVTDPDPADTTYRVDYALLLRDEGGAVEARHDRHVEGLFPRAAWRRALGDAGFETDAREDAYGRTLFLGRRPG